MAEPTIELVQLENGDIVLRRSDTPDNHLVTISFSSEIGGFLGTDQLEVAREMVEAGMDSYRDIQIERIHEAHEDTDAVPSILH